LSEEMMILILFMTLEIIGLFIDTYLRVKKKC